MKARAKYELEMVGLEETPTGLKARLIFGDDHREQINVQLVHIMQDYELEKLRDN